MQSKCPAFSRDTVSSVGAIIPRTLPFAQGSNYIRHFRQAFALDERRARYAEQPYIFDTSEPPFSSVGSYFAVPSSPCSVKEVWFAGSVSRFSFVFAEFELNSIF